ncbi:DUF499 domain-containing protein [Runella slithyformis]|uniref:Swt1-like HEPN domain-containing protein n=1 Tax=Runella slithyformis (strain ATCC 29530 / DSM 19594 / LMG 11500 / NCIMB 11436 / LSU 4) TaxID=761193 RepID=A0A7U4E7Q2_RUNSL|nr:DUF499 domain-containing protein [Runella slithyformis]AEI50619.1 hypothetical protein Runsl_4278 [Runella slithyformis DSM 19594]
MNSTQLQRENLTKALVVFIEAFRPYIVSVLLNEYGETWPAEYANTVLLPDQRAKWNEGLRSGSTAMGLLDYPHFKHFAIKYKNLIRQDFEKKTGDLPNWLGEIYETRNRIAHYNEQIETDEATKTWIHMRTIARILKMTELEEELKKLEESSGSESKHEPKVTEALPSGSQAWFRVVQPHFDIRLGRLDESVFAANLAEVALGNGREVYKDASTFFSKTYFTAGLKNIAKTVLKGLNGKEDAENRVISLQTGFGGGKTHTLISLFHLCKGGKSVIESPNTEELLRYTGIPEFDSANIAVFTNTTNDAANGRKTADGVHIQTIWGELAYQLGGKEAYEIVRKNDEQLIAPAGLFKSVLGKCMPALILVDELADYCVKASARKAGSSSLADQTISFMQELTEAVAGTNHCVAVITLPASPQEVGNTPEAQAILNSLQKRVSRVGADTQPVADDEIFEVIRRRLFENIGDPRTIEAVVSNYLGLYQQYWTELPSHAAKSEYKQRMLKAYPFHPELIDIFRVRWASHHDFQRTRGVLRLLASIVSDLWQRQHSLAGANRLIHSGVVNFATLDSMSGQLKKLYGNGYDAVITADVAGAASNAFKIDSTKREYGQWDLTQSISSVILMSSFGSDGANKGVSVAELKLHLLNPDGFNHNNINGALNELEGVAHYLYYAQTGGAGKRYWFHTKPNINILINQAKGDIKDHDVTAEILKRIDDKRKNVQFFNVLVNPPEDIPEQTRPTLIILGPHHVANPTQVNGQTKPLIERIATKKGNSERIYRNTMLFLLCSEAGIGKLHSCVREYLACQKINQEYQNQLERDQKDDLRRRMEEASKQTETALVVAYSIVVKYAVKSGIDKIVIKQFKESLDSQINQTIIAELKEQEWLLESVGLGTLRTNQLLPTPDHAVKVKDIYEAFIRFDDKPMVTGKDAVSRSIQKYCTNGEYCIATGDGSSFTRYFFQESIPFFDVDDVTYWLVDKSLKPQPQAPVPVSIPDSGNVTTPISIVNEPFVSPQAVGDPDIVKQLKSIIISGKVPLERYTELFNYFITPFAMNGNRIEIEVKFKIKSSESNPIDESKPQYKSAKEAAKQLGLNFEEE